MTVEGIDISHWQTSTPPLGTSLGFVFVRATYGTARDDLYAMHARNVRAAGKVLGAYAFGRDMDGAAQARAFLAVIGDAKLVALDYERDGDHGHMTRAQAAAFIRAVQATGRRCGLYASESGFPYDLGQDWHWIANWDQRPRGSWAFWQYAVSGTPRIDRDRFNGDMAELQAMAGQLPDTSTGDAMALPVLSTEPKVVALTLGDKLYDTDGTYLADVKSATTRPSPYEVKLNGAGHRVIHAVVDTSGVSRMVLVRTSAVTLTDPPASGPTEADVARARAAGVAEGTAAEKARIREVLSL